MTKLNKNKFTLSFEFFPPKSAEGSEHLYQTALNLSYFQPDFFSVTFGAGGSTRSGTIETVNMLQHQTNIPIAPHLSSIGFSKADILDMLRIYQAMSVQHLVALRGDLPSGMGQAGEIKYASELVSCIREFTGDYFTIDVAAYPEIHPQAEGALLDILNLKRKYEAGANSAITQYFFNADAYFYLRDDCQRFGIHMPIIPGIMPIIQFTKLARFSEACGAEIPRWIRKRIESYHDDIESIKKFGLEIIQQLCERLISGGAPGLHFYTLNKDELCIELVKSLGLTPQPRLARSVEEVS